MKHSHSVALVILDGFGYSTEKKYNAIAHAHMPYFNEWWKQYPHALLQASGVAVGLPDGMIGNSEVGHLTMGAGRVIDQPMKIWLDAIDNNSFENSKLLHNNFEKLKNVGGVLHIMGLLSDAGVHAHEKQIHASIKAAINAGIKKIVVHPFLDGRDVAPRSAYMYLERLSHIIKQYNNNGSQHVIIGSLHGRFYAMDRDHNWDRIEKSYRVLTENQSESYLSWEKVLENNYMQGITDEFIVPTQLDAAAIVRNGDGILFCNIRPDRARELTMAFVYPTNPSQELVPFIRKPLDLTFFMTPVMYDKHLTTVALFPRLPIINTLKDVLVMHGKTIFSIAETEKYAHVTYFFRGENEEPVATEERILIPSIITKDYIDYPCMSADKITDAVVDSLQKKPADFYLINYANADMVGHSGDFNATVKAVECLDKQLKMLYDVIVQQMNGSLCITADHGKAEQMYNEIDGQPMTAHTSNPVPFIMIKKDIINDALPLTQLSDIAPFILNTISLPVPSQMMD